MTSKNAYVAYYRVSTDKQGRSGLGLSAQRTAIRNYVNGRPIIAEFEEVESGAKHDRPELGKALAYAKKHSAVLVIATLSRLGRSVAFVANLMERGVPFEVADKPGADPFRLHVEAAVDEEERRRVSERTRKAMAEKRAQGAVFGGYRGGHASPAQLDVSRAIAHDAISKRVQTYVENVLPNIVALKDQGLSLTQIAKALTEAGVATSRGQRDWQSVQVRRVLARAA